MEDDDPVSLDLDVSIVHWSIGHDGGRLHLVVRVAPLDMTKAFCRLFSGQPSKWRWKTYDNDDIPNKAVSWDAWPILNNLVLCHPVLNKIASDFGIEGLDE